MMMMMMMMYDDDDEGVVPIWLMVSKSLRLPYSQTFKLQQMPKHNHSSKLPGNFHASVLKLLTAKFRAVLKKCPMCIEWYDDIP
jgi:hypothetical protein